MRWLALAALFLLIGMILGAPLLVYAGYVLVAVLFVSRVLTDRWSSGLSAERQVSLLEAKVGQEIQVGIVLVNRSGWPIPWVLVEDLLPASALMYTPPNLEVHGQRVRVVLLAKEGRKLLNYRLTCHRRGYYQIGPTVLETGDLLGLQRRFQIAAEPQFLLVYPRVIPLTGFDVASPRPIGEIQLTHALVDDPTRLAGVRLYQPGDPLRRVHWKATARSGELHSKVYEPTCVAGAMIVVDFHVRSNPQRHEPLRGELAASAAASIAQALYELAQPAGLVSNGRDAAERIRTEGWRVEYGTRSAAHAAAGMREASDRLRPVVVGLGQTPQTIQEIHRTLARLERTDGLTLAQLLIEAEPRLSRQASVLVILQQPTKEDLAAMVSLSRRGWMLTAAVNTYEPSDFATIAGALLAGGIQPLHLRDFDAISALCRRVVQRS